VLIISRTIALDLLHQDTTGPKGEKNLRKRGSKSDTPRRACPQSTAIRKKLSAPKRRGQQQHVDRKNLEKEMLIKKRGVNGKSNSLAKGPPFTQNYTENSLHKNFHGRSRQSSSVDQKTSKRRKKKLSASRGKDRGQPRTVQSINRMKDGDRKNPRAKSVTYNRFYTAGKKEEGSTP